MSTLSVRRPLALLAVLGMVATLLFAVVGTASAATVTPSNEALFSACPENANISDAGFDDVPAASNSFDAINCLAYYAVTAGTTPDTYGPSETVSRTQMAVFLARMAESAGVDLDSSPPAAGFTDIGGLSAEAQDAINALAATTPPIVSGTSATTFNPTGTVSRTQMALFLTRFSDAASAPSHGPGGIQAKNVSGTTTNFADISSVVADSQKAITRVFHLGVASGTSATTYDPTGTVSRAQMAMFMTRLMGQMNTRPAGVNVQAVPATGVVEGDPGETTFKASVTVRNTDFSAKPWVYVDAFVFVAAKATTMPFNADTGICEDDDTFPHPDNDTVCLLEDGDDARADGYGNILPITENTVGDPFATAYAWTAADGVTLNKSMTYSSAQVSTGDAPAAPTDAKLSVDVDSDSDPYTVSFGTEVTWTVQLLGSDGLPFAKAGVDVEFTDTWDDDEDIVTLDSGEINRTVATDASGKATYSVTEESIAVGRDATHSVEADIVTPSFNDDIEVRWTDTAPVVTTLVLSMPSEYMVVPATGVVATNTLTATAYDQYGDVFMGTGYSVQFERDSDDLGGDVVLHNGVAIRSYDYDHGGYTVWDRLDATLYKGVDAVGGETSDDADFYWAFEGEDDPYVFTAMGAVKVGDVDNNALVGYDGSDYWLLKWDSGDTFLDGGGASSQADFETAIKALKGFEVAYEATAADVSVWDLD